jgi:hypothetical protein
MTISASAEIRTKRLETIPIFVDDMDDDEMLRLMVDENATQRGGTNAGAIMNEVASITRRLAEALLQSSDNCPKIIARLFDGPRG